MTEFSNLVSVALVGSSQKTFQFVADEFTFEPTVNDDNGGVYWDCGKTFVVDMPDSEAVNQLKTPRKAIVSLKKLTRMRPESDSNVTRMCSLSDPSLIPIGTNEVPARVHLVPHLNKAKLVVSCKMLTNPMG